MLSNKHSFVGFLEKAWLRNRVNLRNDAKVIVVAVLGSGWVSKCRRKQVCWRFTVKTGRGAIPVLLW